MYDIVLRSHLCPGDAVAQTSAIRDLHQTFPGWFRTFVDSSCPAVWENNPHITPREQMAAPRTFSWTWQAAGINRRHVHFSRLWAEDLERNLGVRILPGAPQGEIYLTDAERSVTTEEMTGEDGPYCVIASGMKTVAPLKYWGHANYQAVVDAFRGRLRFVQIGVGGEGYVNRRLDGAIDRVNQTDLRQLATLVHRADLVLCGISLPMHLAAAVERPRGVNGARPCVVLAGGIEPRWLTQYAGQTQLSMVGAIHCASDGACWAHRFDDGSESWLKACANPGRCADERVPRCQELIRPRRVIDAIEGYYAGGMLRYR